MTKTQPKHYHNQLTKHHHHQGRRHCTSCIIATATFLILLTLALLILFYTLFRPHNLTITTLSIHLPSFSTTTSTITSTTTLATFTFSLYAPVKNPSRFSVFSHIDSSLQLLYANHQVGFIFIPAGKIGSGRTRYVSATFTVQSFPMEVGVAVEEPEPAVMGGLGGGGTMKRVGAGGSLEMESRMVMKGGARFLHFFTFHAEAVSDCWVNVGVSDGSVLGFRC